MPRHSAAVTHLGPAEVTDDNKPTLGRIAQLLKPYSRKMVEVLAIVVVSATLSALVPFLTKAVFDQALFAFQK